MDKPKRDQLRIEKTKEGIPVIHLHKEPRMTWFLGFLALCFGLVWLLQLYGFQSYLTILIGLEAVLVLAAVSFYLYKHEIRLEPDFIVLRTRIFLFYRTRSFPIEDLASTSTGRIENIFTAGFKPHLIAYFRQGKRLLLSPLDFAKESHVSEVADFINDYYGLNEKPKTKNEEPNHQ